MQAYYSDLNQTDPSLTEMVEYDEASKETKYTSYDENGNIESETVKDAVGHVVYEKDYKDGKLKSTRKCTWGFPEE